MLKSIPRLDKRGGGGSLTEWQFDCGATIALQSGGKKRQAGRRKAGDTLQDAQFSAKGFPQQAWVALEPRGNSSAWRSEEDRSAHYIFQPARL